jgi:hypothetical protein
VGKALFNHGGCFGGDDGFADGFGHAVDLPLVGALSKRPISGVLENPLHFRELNQCWLARRLMVLTNHLQTGNL